MISVGKSGVEGDLNCPVNVRLMETDVAVIPLFAKQHDGTFSYVAVDRTIFRTSVLSLQWHSLTFW